MTTNQDLRKLAETAMDGDRIAIPSDQVIELLDRIDRPEAENKKMRDETYNLSEMLAGEYATLSWGIAEGCRCLGCHEYQMRDTDNKVLCSGETMEQLHVAITQHLKGTS